MDFLEWATSPWGQSVPIHIAWFLIWVAVIAGLLFFIVHATYVRYFAKTKEFAGNVSPAAATGIPEHVPRHSLTARLFLRLLWRERRRLQEFMRWTSEYRRLVL